MKITIENYGKKMSVETDHEDVSMDEYMDMIFGLLVTATFHPQTVIDGFRSFVEEKDL